MLGECSPVLPTVGRGAHADLALELARKRAVIVESGGLGDFGNGERRTGEQLAALENAQLGDVAARGNLEELTELALEVAWRKIHRAGQILD